jgi:hypothetical protein
MLVPNRKHITPPLQAQQVNALYTFVMMVLSMTQQREIIAVSVPLEDLDRIQSPKPCI